MATFVLVHGAWGGGWQWERLRPLLEAEGHRVLAPSLTGMGDRAHLIGADVGLETHIADIARLLEWEELSDVVLVGHSYAGMVLTGVAGRTPQRLSHLVYIDAFLPKPGQSVLGLMPFLADLSGEPRPSDPHGYPLPAFAEAGLTSADEAAWIARRGTSIPVLAFQQPLPAPAVDGAGVPGTYVWCESNAYHEETARQAAADGFELVTWPGAGHWLPLFAPARTAEILLAVAARVDAGEAAPAR